jgi:hypothetical protein
MRPIIQTVVERDSKGRICIHTLVDKRGLARRLSSRWRTNVVVLDPVLSVVPSPASHVQSA